MNGNDPFSRIPKDTRDFLEGEGTKLEACETVIGERTVMVITYQVDYGDRPSFKTPPGLVKFSKKEHAIPNSKHIRLGSSRYYREYEEGADGVADLEEGRMVQRGTLSEFCRKNGVPSRPGFEHVSSTVTWARRDFLMFCMSTTPQVGSIGELWSQFPDYDCATFIADPSTFAVQLGKDIGNQFDMDNVRLDIVDRIRQSMLPQVEMTTQGRPLHKGLDMIILVLHGPVTYCDPPEEIVNRHPIERRAEVVPFVKRGRYAGQREYRFVLGLIGEPKQTEFLMEITDELRGLTCPYSEPTKLGTGVR